MQGNKYFQVKLFQIEQIKRSLRSRPENPLESVSRWLYTGHHHRLRYQSCQEIIIVSEWLDWTHKRFTQYYPTERILNPPTPRPVQQKPVPLYLCNSNEGTLYKMSPPLKCDIANTSAISKAVYIAESGKQINWISKIALEQSFPSTSFPVQGYLH